MRLNPNSIFRYRGWDRKFHKKQKGYMGFVNDYHVIPKQFRNHKLIQKTHYDINGNFNLMIMPTPVGLQTLNVSPIPGVIVIIIPIVYVGNVLNDIWNSEVELKKRNTPFGCL